MRRAFWSRWLVALLLVGVPVIWGLVKWQHNRALVVSVITLVICWALVLALLEWAGRNDGNVSIHGGHDLVSGQCGEWR
jgi:hypothetical protein